MTGRLATAAVLLLLGPAGPLPAAAQTRETPYGWPAAGISLAGDLTGVIGPADHDAFFNYTDYERDALRLARLRLVTEWRAASRLSFVAELRSESGDAFDAAAWYVRWRPRDTLQIQAGRIPPVIGAFPRRAYGRDQFVITAPLGYQYLTSLRPDALPATIEDVLAMRGRGWRPFYPYGNPAPGPGVPQVSGLRWDTGVQASWRRGWFEGAAAVTLGAPAVPVVSDPSGGVQWSGRAALAMPDGSTVGVSLAHGAWVDDRALESLPATAARDRDQRLIGVDAETGRGRWLLRSEWLHATFELPLANEPVAAQLGSDSIFVEGRYRLHARWQVAARAGHLTFARVVRPSDGVRLSWDAPVTRLEAVVAYRATRHLELRGGVQYHWRDGGRVRERGYPTAAVLYWF